jgi:hypothetical protein
VALNSKGKKFLLICGILTVGAVIFIATVAFLATRPVDIELAQDPNPVEAHLAGVKLKLLNDARETRRQGYVRFSEVEINSLLDPRYHKEKLNRTNDPVQLVKTAVMLHRTNLTVVTWLRAPLQRLAVPLIWQRTVFPVKQGQQWNFEISEMRLGTLKVPRLFWPQVDNALGSIDQAFEERKTWLTKFPKIALMKNELSHAPELRLFTYSPLETLIK